jgi:hypothetical protein
MQADSEPPAILYQSGDEICCKLDSTLCIETSKELRTRQAEAVYEEHADQSLTKQLVTCSMDTAYPPIRNKIASVREGILRTSASKARLFSPPAVMEHG